jgi:hypothetical protein
MEAEIRKDAHRAGSIVEEDKTKEKGRRAKEG